jgi:hypothetical protein
MVNGEGDSSNGRPDTLCIPHLEPPLGGASTVFCYSTSIFYVFSEKKRAPSLSLRLVPLRGNTEEGRTRIVFCGSTFPDARGYRRIHGGARWFALPAVSASSTHLIKVDASEGLTRKHTAPWRNARARTDSSGNAVMKMIGTVRPWWRSRVCSSSPPMSGICTSVITHDVSSNWGERINSAADANVSTA